MFPQINKKKKKEFSADEPVLKQWQSISQQLQIKSKLSIKRIPNQILHDFSKVCRIKSIPQFYANYFICNTYKTEQAEMHKVFKEQIESILTQRSYFHRINQALRQRQDILQNLRESLQIIQGFILMNQGKAIPLRVRSTIDELVTQCESLEKLKEIQRKKTEDFAINIIKIRTNTSQLIILVNEWRSYLQALNKNQPNSKKITKIYPHQGINCLLIPWYDTLFLRQSVLKTQLLFGRDDHDPFLQRLSKAKKGSEIQNYLLEYLKADTTNYSEQANTIKNQYPSDQLDKMRQKQLELQQRKEQKLKQQKSKEQKLKQLRQNKKNSSNLRIVRHSSSLKSINIEKQKQEVNKSIRYKTSQKGKSTRKIINVDLLISGKNHQQKLKQESKIFKVYKKSNNKDLISKLNISVVSQEELINEKKVWQKQIKQQQIQKQKIKKLLKITQKKAIQQTRLFEQKLKKYEEQVNNLKSKVENQKKPQRISSSNSKSPTKNKKAIESIYGNNSNHKDLSQINKNFLQSKLQEESRLKQSLQSQIKELTKQKLKMQKLLQKEGMRLSKEDELNRKKIDKYEQVITKLKGESESNRKAIKYLQSSKINQQKSIADNLRMYTLKQKQQQLKNHIQTKIYQKQLRKKNRQSKIQEQKARKSIESILNKSLIRSQKSLSNSRTKNVQIIKTKQTIQIVFQTKNTRKRQSEPIVKQQNQSQIKLRHLQKERQILEKKLQMSTLGKQDTKKVFQSKLNQKDLRVQRIRQQVQRQKDRNTKLQQNMRKMRKNISSQYEVKLNKQKLKYQKERQELLKTIQKQRYQKDGKEKLIEQQMNFLKQMEKKEEELIDMLQEQKRQKKNRQASLAKQLEQKEELMNLIYIEEIKKGIERQVRKQLLQSEDQGEQDMLMLQKRLRLQQQIEQLKMERNQELVQMDQQNEKLKDLISRIKGEQHQLLQAIRENIQYQTSEEQEQKEQKDENIQGQSPKEYVGVKTFSDLQEENQILSKELASKTLQQFKHEEHKKQQYFQISQDTNYKQKEKIENIVQLYLKSPHKYPGDQPTKLNPKEKTKIVYDTTKKAKQIQDFQDSLFSVKDLPDYVPSMKNSTLTNHLLNLRQQYDNYEADSLRRQLFPPLQDEVYNQKELSVESQEPMNTLMDHVRAHNKNYPSKKDDKKNFLAINRMRLMILQQNRKDKQRSLIQQQSKKKIQKQIMEKNRKKRQQKLQRQRLKEEHQQKLRQLQNKDKKEKKQKKLKKSKDKFQKSSQNEASSLEKPSKKKIQQKSQEQSKQKQKTQQNFNKSQMNTFSDKNVQKSQQESQQQDKNIKPIRVINDKNFEVQIPEKKKKQQKGPKQLKETKSDFKKTQIIINPIKQQATQQSQVIKQSQIQNLQNQKDIEKKEKQILKSEVLSIQSEVRQYIKSYDQFEVYQQFVNEEEMLTYVQEILQLSSLDLVNLNGNLTLKEDIKYYTSLTILIAKNNKGIEIGIGIFHKEYEIGQYVCDYILAHNMQYFLDLIFNFSRFIFQNDKNVSKTEYLFNLKHIQKNEKTIIPFLQFEKKCHRLGQVYVKENELKERKYILKRALFEQTQAENKIIEKGIDISLNLQVFDDLLRQVNQGFVNTLNINHGSISVILAYYLSKNSDLLARFRQKIESQLYYREILITSLLFNKKQLQLKTLVTANLSNYKFLEYILSLKQQFDVRQAQSIQETTFSISENMPKNLKRCTLSVGYEQIRYLVFHPEESVASLQSSNSSETGYFLSIIPKYKVMIIQAEQYIAMNTNNSNLTVFFYIKHFIKNIVDVRKESFQRIYLPQIYENTTSYFDDLSKKMSETVLLKQNVRLGWKNELSNSIIFSPKHRDLVIQKPFIIAVLSGNIERAVEGSPIFVRLIT